MHKIGQPRGVLGRLLGICTVLTLIGNVLKPLAKSVLRPLGLTAVASAIDAATHKKMFGSGFPLDLASRNATLIISNGEMNGIMKIIKSLEESGLLIKSVSGTFRKEMNEQKEGFISILLGALGVP